MPKIDVRFGALLGCFFLSGTAGLTYQVAWSRQFGLVFGTTELAIATVLAAFLGGLGIGSALVARHQHRIRRPLMLFGILELTIGLSALAIPLALGLASRLQVALLGNTAVPAAAGGTAATAFHLLVSLAILLVPTACMGATLPLLTRFAIRRDAQVGSRVALLYAINTAGAVIGAVTTGFILLPQLGLLRTTWIAAGTNLAVFALALMLGRQRQSAVTSADTDITETVETSLLDGNRDSQTVSTTVRRTIPWLVAGAGLLALGYEVLWTRLLSHLIGSGIEAFATMLASFLVGIAGGSLLAARWARTPMAGVRGLILAQMAAGVGSVLSFFAIDVVAGQLGHPNNAISAAMAAGVALLPGALAMGATFPFAVRARARNAAEASNAAATVYASNTAGAVAGALLVGFLVLPSLGFAGTLTAIALGNFVIAGIAARLLGRAARNQARLCLALMATLLVLRPETPWRALRHIPLPVAQDDHPFDTSDVTFHAVGRTATVLLIDRGSEWDLRTNGLPEGTVQPPGLAMSRYLVTPWLGALPSMLRPETDRVLVIGLGAGVVLEAIPSTVSEIDLIEIEPEVIAANRQIGEQRRLDPLADPRLRLITNDARSALLLTRQRYDAIVSQPSHPWTGSGHLYSREFFGLVRDHLAPSGRFVQWIGLGALDESLLASVVATFADTFAQVAVFWPPGGNALLLVGSAQPIDWQATGTSDGSFAALGVVGPEDLAAALVLDDAGARKLATGATINTDDHNQLQARSARLLGAGLGNRARPIIDPMDPWSSGVATGLNPRRVTRRLIELGQTARARRLVNQTTEPDDRRYGQALLARSTGRARVAATLFDELLSIDPANEETRAALLQLHRGALARSGEPPARLVPLTVHELAIVAGWRAAFRGDLETLRRLDGDLATLPPISALYPEALRLRAAWRVHDPDLAVARAAQDHLAPLIARGGDPETAVLSAHAALSVGQRRAALALLEDIARQLGGGSNPIRVRSLWILDQLATGADAIERQRIAKLRDALDPANPQPSRRPEVRSER